MKRTFWQGRPWQAFKNFAIIFSFVMNLLLLIVLLLVGGLALPVANDLAEPIVGGLSDSFVEMGEARIVQTIQVRDEIPIAFTLPLSTTSIVTTTAPVDLAVPAQFALPGGGGNIFGTVVIQLPAGLPLPVSLNIDVPVEQRIPVELAVDVDIPLAQTDLGQPFGRLQAIFGPLHRLLRSLPEDNEALLGRLRGEPEDPAGAATQAP
jgi:hypothetical protein